MDPMLLLALLLLNVFLIGVVATIGIRHARAHINPDKHASQEKQHTPSYGGHLPDAVWDDLIETAQARFQIVLDRSAADLQSELKSTTEQLNYTLERRSTDVVNVEMHRYKTLLEDLRNQTQNVVTDAEEDIKRYQDELKASLSEQKQAMEKRLAIDYDLEKQRLIQRIDTKLADSVAAFLTETLQHNVDLGSQSAYLISMLEEHKEELKKEVSDDT
jgi:uncharacterized membrane protein